MFTSCIIVLSLTERINMTHTIKVSDAQLDRLKTALTTQQDIDDDDMLSNILGIDMFSADDQLVTPLQLQTLRHEITEIVKSAVDRALLLQQINEL